jgi:hypothetical protein
MISRLIRDTWQYIEHMSVQHWFYVLVIAVVVGFLCLRGFGSRTNY